MKQQYCPEFAGMSSIVGKSKVVNTEGPAKKISVEISYLYQGNICTYIRNIAPLCVRYNEDLLSKEIYPQMVMKSAYTTVRCIVGLDQILEKKGFKKGTFDITKSVISNIMSIISDGILIVSFSNMENKEIQTLKALMKALEIPASSTVLD